MAAIAMVRHQMNRLSRGRAPHPGVSPLRALVEDQLSVAWQARGHGAARNHRRLAGAQAPLSAVGSAAMTGRLVRIEAYLPHRLRVTTSKPPAPPSRSTHGDALKLALESAVTDANRRREDAGIKIPGAVPGLYVLFESQPDVPLKLSSLEDARQGIELVAVSHAQTEGLEAKRIERATVFVPEGKVKHFISRFEAYAKTEEKQKGERRHEDMLDPVATLRLATLRGLWTDTAEAYPADHESIWWEIWLRRQDGNELARLMEFAQLTGLVVSARRLQFDDRIVTLARATAKQLSTSIDVLNDLAEVRRAKETAQFFIDLPPNEQGEWATNLIARTTPAAYGAPTVCLLDTGVTLNRPGFPGDG